MSDEIQLTLKVTEQGLEVFDAAGQKMSTLAGKANEVKGGFASLVEGGADVFGAIQGIAGSLSAAGGMIQNMNDIGVASLRAKAGLDAWTGGNATSAITAMQKATHGLVDDTDLANMALQAFATSAVTTQDQLNELSRAGAILGLTFQGDAGQGIQMLTKDIEMVGSTRGLKQLGIDAVEVKKNFEELKKTMSDQDAWRMAVMGVASENANKLKGALDGTGTSLQRLELGFENFKQSAGENVATGIEGIINILQKIPDHFDIVVKAVLEESYDIHAKGNIPNLTPADQAKNPYQDAANAYNNGGGIPYQSKAADTPYNVGGSGYNLNSRDVQNSNMQLQQINAQNASLVAQAANENVLLDLETRRNNSAMQHTTYMQEQADLTSKLESSWFNAPGQAPGSIQDIEKQKIDYMKNAMATAGKSGTGKASDATIDAFKIETAKAESGDAWKGMDAGAKEAFKLDRGHKLDALTKDQKGGGGGTSLYSKAQIDSEADAMEAANDKIAIALGQTTEAAVIGRKGIDALGKQYATSAESADAWANKVIAAHKAMSDTTLSAEQLAGALANIKLFGSADASEKIGIAGSEGGDTSSAAGIAKLSQGKTGGGGKLPPLDNTAQKASLAEVGTDYDTLHSKITKIMKIPPLNNISLLDSIREITTAALVAQGAISGIGDLFRAGSGK